MKKLNLLNSLVFALALQSSVNSVAGGYTKLEDALGEKKSEGSSYINKKNVAIAAVGALAAYEVWKATQAYKNLTGKNFANEIAKLHKEDAEALANLAKNSFNKARNFSPRQFANNSVATIKTQASSLRNASVNTAKNAYNKAAVLAVAAKSKLQNVGSKAGNSLTSLYRKCFPIKSVVDTSFSPIGVTNRELGLVSRCDEAYNIAQQSFPGELTSRELSMVSRLNEIATESQLTNLASSTAEVAKLDNFNNVAELTSKAAGNSESYLDSLVKQAKSDFYDVFSWLGLNKANGVNTTYTF